MISVKRLWLLFCYLLVALLCAYAMPAPAVQAVQAQSWERDFGLTILNEDRLPERNRLALRAILAAVPRALYEHLECISISAPPGCETIGLRGMNIFANGNTD